MLHMPLRPLAGDHDRHGLPAGADPAAVGRLPAPGDKVVVVGSGKSGQAACRLLAARGCRVHLLEAGQIADGLKADLEALGCVVETGAHTKEQFADAAFVIPSPGVSLRSLLGIMGLPRDSALEGGEGPAILAETELAWRCLAEGGRPLEKIIAVTGTSGKTTTVHLIAGMLTEAGYTARLAGNVGTPLSQYLLDLAGGAKRADVLVVEISSFQLQTCVLFRPDVAVLMNITPNHLDYHADMAEYIAAKLRLFACQTAEDKAIVPAEWQKAYEEEGFAACPVQVQVQHLFADTPLFGEHNALNAETAFEAVKAWVPMEAAARAVAGFTPLAHRLERVCEQDGILYVNDSKSTTLTSMETALRAFDRPVLLLCGGHFKGGDPAELAPLVREKVRLVAGFGDSKEIFQPAWEGIVPIQWFPTLRPAVLWLQEQARAGDVILLSPGTASFDLYRGMAYRGADFKAIVADICAARAQAPLSGTVSASDRD